MRAAIKREFGNEKPRAVVLDDHSRSRHLTARRLKKLGFAVEEYADVPAFRKGWRPGTVDVIIADWDLSDKKSDQGDHVLEEVRKRDWDVPFVLVSGKLEDEEDERRLQVLGNLLESGSARFVRRGSSGIEKVCHEAEDLIERRDLALLKTILSLRSAALQHAEIMTSSGKKPVGDLLSELVARPEVSHNMDRPVAQALAREKAGFRNDE